MPRYKRKYKRSAGLTAEQYVKLLNKFGWNSARLARELKIKPSSLCLRLKRLGINAGEAKKEYLKRLKASRGKEFFKEFAKYGYDKDALAKALGTTGKVVKEKLEEFGYRYQPFEKVDLFLSLDKKLEARLEQAVKWLKEARNIDTSRSELARALLRHQLDCRPPEAHYCKLLEYRKKQWLKNRNRPKIDNIVYKRFQIKETINEEQNVICPNDGHGVSEIENAPGIIEGARKGTDGQ